MAQNTAVIIFNLMYKKYVFLMILHSIQSLSSSPADVFHYGKGALLPVDHTCQVQTLQGALVSFLKYNLNVHLHAYHYGEI